MKIVLWFGCFVTWVSCKGLTTFGKSYNAYKFNKVDTNADVELTNPFYSRTYDPHRFDFSKKEVLTNSIEEEEKNDIPTKLTQQTPPSNWFYKSPFDTNIWSPPPATPKPLCKEMHVLLDPDNCQQFYMCIKGQYKRQTCPYGMYYNNNDLCTRIPASYCKQQSIDDPSTTTIDSVETTRWLTRGIDVINESVDDTTDASTTTESIMDSNDINTVKSIDSGDDYGDLSSGESTTTIESDSVETTRWYSLAFDDINESVDSTTDASTTTEAIMDWSDLNTFKSIVSDDDYGYLSPSEPETTQEESDEALMIFDVEGNPVIKIILSESSEDVVTEPYSSIETTTVQDTTGYKAVCYLSITKKFDPFALNVSLCTHIILAHLHLDENDLLLYIYNEENQMLKSLLAKIRESDPKRTTKLLLSVGGWEDSESDKYSRLVNDPESRERFVDQAVETVKQYGVDGLDLKWQYPKCWKNRCDLGPDSDKPAFAALIKELHEAFEPQSLLLSAYVSPVDTIIDVAYDVPVLTQYLDWISIMTYEYHGHWDGKTGHIAPLYDPADYFNADYTIKYWINKGADRKKLLMGVPLYAQTFTLKDKRRNTLRSLTKGPGKYNEGKSTLPYNKVCRMTQSENWEVVRNSGGLWGPYAYKGDQWMSYDDVSEMIRKANYIKDRGLGGVMVQSLNEDDWNGDCGHGKYPLLNALNHQLRGDQFHSDLQDVTTDLTY